MNSTKNPPPSDQGLAFQTHALQMILFGPFYVRTQRCYGSLRIVSLQDQLQIFVIKNLYFLRLCNILNFKVKYISHPLNLGSLLDRFINF